VTYFSSDARIHLLIVGNAMPVSSETSLMAVFRVIFFPLRRTLVWRRKTSSMISKLRLNGNRRRLRPDITARFFVDSAVGSVNLSDKTKHRKS